MLCQVFGGEAETYKENEMPQKRKRFLTGIKPTGDIHLGNYFGAIKPIIESSKDPANETILLCPDWHGLTNRAQVFLPGESTPSVMAVFLALGFNLEGNILLLQSDFPQIHENAWYLSCASSAGLLERSHAYKDAIANGKDATAGLLFYPALMASDIITFDAEYVPIGKDQAQHLEYASDMAKHFNHLVGKPVFKEPKALLQETPQLIGTDGERKMSKSYNNVVPLFATLKELEKVAKEIKTDSKGLNDPKDPDTCTIFQIFKAFASPEATEYMRDRLEKGTNYGYGHAKKDFIDEHQKIFGLYQERYEHYLNNPAEVQKLVRPGYEQAKSYADAVVKRARNALGLKSYW